MCVCVCRSLRKPDPVETIGFEVDEVKHAGSGDCMVRLTVYHRTSGNVSAATFTVGLLAVCLLEIWDKSRCCRSFYIGSAMPVPAEYLCEIIL